MTPKAFLSLLNKWHFSPGNFFSLKRVTDPCMFWHFWPWRHLCLYISPPPYILLLLLLFSSLQILPPPLPELALLQEGRVRTKPACPNESCWKRRGGERKSFTCCRVKSMWKLYCKIINQAEPQSAACPCISHYSLELQTQGHACSSHCGSGAVKSRKRRPRGRSCPRKEGCGCPGGPRRDSFGLCGEDAITLPATNL